MIKQNFFVIDSDRLNEVDTGWYGYMVTPTGIYDWDNAPGRVNKDMLSGLGAYVFIDRQQEQIDIYQDYNGSWGLCFYQNDGKFVISNSVLLLIEYLSGSVRLTLNREYAYYLMGNPLSDMMLEDTIVNEIRLIESGATIHINTARRFLIIRSRVEGVLILIQSRMRRNYAGSILIMQIPGRAANALRCRLRSDRA